MSAILLSTGGVVLGLWAANQPFGIVMCGLGVIALAGIVVNNNIVLIDTYNEYTRRGYRAREAAFRAGLVRFRPVVLTAVTTILGLLPMVFQLTIKIMDRGSLLAPVIAMVDTALKHHRRRPDLRHHPDACRDTGDAGHRRAFRARSVATVVSAAPYCFGAA